MARAAARDRTATRLGQGRSVFQAPSIPSYPAHRDVVGGSLPPESKQQQTPQRLPRSTGVWGDITLLESAVASRWQLDPRQHFHRAMDPPPRVVPCVRRCCSVPLSSLLISFSEEAGMHQPATPPPMKEALPLKSRHCIDLCRSITNRHHLYRSPYAAHLHHPRFQPATTVCLEARESTLQRCAPVNQWPVTTMRRAPLADAPSPSAFCHFTSLHPGRLTMVDG